METLGKYTLLKRLGAGGMGEVFLAQALESDAPLVVKRILPHLTSNPRFLRLFLDETRIASRLVHPNIVRIFELGEAGGTWYVAMEHVPGKDLRELNRRAREAGVDVPVEVVVKIGVEIARALEHAHAATDAQGRSLKIVHRDVSPHNVLVSRAGEVKLIDFGVAKAANKSVHTATGILKGKFPYMAPEQANARAVDARTDVFALGIVLWEALTGKHLFRGRSDAATLKQVRAAAVDTPLTFRPHAPEPLARVLLKALRKEPKERYQTARAMREALEAELAALPAPDLAGWLREHDDVPGLDDSSESGELSEAMAFLPEEATDVGEPGAQTVAGGRLPLLSSSRLAEAREILSQLTGRPTNIGPQATSFVGRVAELADLHQLFRQGARLITLLGPGGTGKTRLSLQLATQLVTHFQGGGPRERSRGGVWFCDLSEATELDGLTAAVARGLAVPLSPGDAVVQLGHAIAARGEVLLVLDNFEQLVALAPDTLERWMRAAPSARFVVTSRELLRVSHETVFEVPAMRTPRAGEAVGTAEAVLLFVERARAARPGWELTQPEEEAVAEIVRQLDGMPLAIELAAARMTMLSPQQLVQRLPRRFELLVAKGASARQATLRGAIDWSWQMLSPAEASGLAQLSVFRGGFTAEAVEAVVDLALVPDGPAPLELLMMLRSRSLVRAYFPLGEEGTTRFGLYESIREYAREKLDAMVEREATHERHARYSLRLGASLAATAEGSARQLDLLDLERDNLNAVFQRSVEAGERGPRALQAVLAVDPVLTLRGPFKAHLAMLDAALALVGGDQALRALGLEARARARQARGKKADAEQDLQEVLALAQGLRDAALEGRAEAYLGLLDRLEGQRAEARRRFERALLLHRTVKDRRMEGRTLSNLAVLLQEMGLEEEAMAAYNEALEVHREVRDRRYEGVSLANLGVLQQALGLLEPARANYQAALAIHRELGNRRSEGISHINLGDLARDLLQPGQARQHYQHALRLVREAGARRFEGIALVTLASLQQEAGELAEAAARYAEGIAVLDEVGDHRYAGLARAGLAAVHAVEGRLAAAEEGMAAATAMLTEAGDAGFLDALDLYRAHLELAQARGAKSEQEASRLVARVEKRVSHAQRAGAPDARHPGGVPSPADRSEQVRAALRSLQVVIKAEPGRA